MSERVYVSERHWARSMFDFSFFFRHTLTMLIPSPPTPYCIGGHDLEIAAAFAERLAKGAAAILCKATVAAQAKRKVAVFFSNFLQKKNFLLDPFGSHFCAAAEVMWWSCC